ncbi:MAG: DUF2695 domain-containing protein [Planctomycetes bacterium]|nr:DUF2695 domain-containing protein [Planctomycetota bacterium]
MLEQELTRHGCDHSLRLVQHWLAASGFPREPVETWLRNNGGRCDCEVLANVRQAWEDAIHDVP